MAYIMEQNSIDIAIERLNTNCYMSFETTAKKEGNSYPNDDIAVECDIDGTLCVIQCINVMC